MIGTLVAFFLVSIVLSFLCSLWEAVLLSITPSYMQVKLNEGGRTGTLLKGFKDNIHRPLAAILTVNTIAHTAGAIGVGQEATIIWANTHPVVTGLVVPAVMTAAILILSEIIPKTIGATNWRMLAPFTVHSLNVIIKLTLPVIWLCQLITKWFSSGQDKHVFSRKDFMAMAQIGSEEGALDESEAKFIENLMRFRNYKAKDVMTPRTVVVSAPQTMTARDFYNMQDDLVFSRVPLRESQNEEAIVGYILKDEVLEHLIDDETDKPLQEFRRDVLYVPEIYSIFQLFNDFIKQREHVAIVVNEYGDMEGLVTMEDIVETLLGAEIVDETDKIVDLQEMAKSRWKTRFKKISALQNGAKVSASSSR